MVFTEIKIPQLLEGDSLQGFEVAVLGKRSHPLYGYGRGPLFILSVEGIQCKWPGSRTPGSFFPNTHPPGSSEELLLTQSNSNFQRGKKIIISEKMIKIQGQYMALDVYCEVHASL